MSAATPTYVPPNVAQAACCRGDDVRHESISEIPVPFADGHACVDCCPCPDCGAYRAEQYVRDPSAWDGAERAGWRFDVLSEPEASPDRVIQEVARWAFRGLRTGPPWLPESGATFVVVQQTKTRLVLRVEPPDGPARYFEVSVGEPVAAVLTAPLTPGSREETV